MAALPLLNAFLDAAARAYSDGLLAASPHATGTFTWSGVSYLQSAMFFRVRHGAVTSDGGAWTPLAYPLWLAGVIIAGRLWRLLPPRTGKAPQADPAAD